MKCDKCGAKVKKKFKLCPICGEEIIIKEKVKIDKKPFNKKNKIILSAILITIIIATIGTIIYSNKSESISTIRKSVVKINVYDSSGEVMQTGSGLIVFNKNILVTNAHVITGGTTADAISESDEKLYIDGAIYYNQDEDIAILKLNNQNSIKPLKTSTKYKSGDKVIAIGSPLGIKNSVSDGMISNILDDKTIQHSAPISPGSSGCALFNSKGRVIGINTATITSGQNINLAIPIGKVEEAYNKNKKNKVKSIKNIQYVSDDVKAVMLNNSAGKELVELVSKLEKSDRKVFFEDSRDYKKTYVKGYYLYKLAENNIAVDWINITVDNRFDEEDKFIESKLPLLKIIKVSDNSDEIISLVEDYLIDDIGGFYSEILRDPEYSELRCSGKDSCNLGKDVIKARYSNAYINAYRSPTISHYGHYVYAIVSKDDDLIDKIEKIIKQLP